MSVWGKAVVECDDCGHMDEEWLDPGDTVPDMHDGYEFYGFTQMCGENECKILCDSCREEYFMCEWCEDYYHRELMVFHDDEATCEECSDDYHKDIEKYLEDRDTVVCAECDVHRKPQTIVGGKWVLT